MATLVDGEVLAMLPLLGTFSGTFLELIERNSFIIQ